ncbi:engulfment and cell motility protein 1 isoform X1 [Ictalurus punctatus]|uniref:Engulfment and cell motility protein 1 n=1 Tax=Ictalurus punctatus TaxID=7998 RepID=W5UAX5_ICTPU|nr:engulfment and cell motility protein 1 isoform X1 [Ictalurus punctatus]XP_053531045.1 engulfment and cell motility protein 1 isoform X1 [Ictalurus punctatus]XP_053531046.1 engulfment and cell motility protein 1 isoform X1 [Ictalurus punctatus]XP_053531047.1 engulfment and cell motility protein 1 isoform X1 [Ictalurus punctatus]XP_053531048.1 engulfment and cell motility protein 1 isoform X1 [Ictalurus punctatus]
MPPPPDILKVAIEWPGAFPKLMEIDQKKPLSAVIKEVCEGWQLPNHEGYALQNADSTNFYITEKNRNNIKNGSILRLTTSPAQMALQLYERIQTGSLDLKLDALKDLANSSRDITFAQEFINLDGISLLTQMVESGTERYQKLQKMMKPCFGEILSYTLTAFVELMDHGIISWDTFSVAFIKKIASFVCKTSTDSAVLQRSLAILESMVLNSQDLYQKVAQEITIGQLMPHLQGTDQDIQTYTIAVINALFLKAPEDKRQEMAHILAQKQLRNIILTNVIRSSKPINDEMAHQLYMLQVLTFNLLEDRMMTKMDPQDQAQRDIIFELRRIAFDVECETSSSGSIEKRRSMYTRDYKKLGFINHVNPAVDFTQIPPGMLALDNMLYFARQHQDSYIRIVLENSSREDKHECPFGRSSIELTKMLCEILKVGELPSENCHDFHPMFFTNDHSFEEFFCICIQLLNKTWKEMRATSEDFNKVMQVVREQITRALTNKPNSLDQFKTRLQNLSYTEILKIRQSERMNQEDFQSRPILELREKIQPEIMELIKQQRLNRLCEGTCFRKISSRRRQDKFWYCRLSPNHKVLHYGDLEESPQGEVPHDSLQDKLPVADIKAVVTGKDCPHMKEKGALKQNKEVLELAFSILYESDEYLNFIAPDKHEYCVWTDGLNALLGKEMTSEFTRSDLDTLLNMEMKLRLLDLENIQIPEAPPPIPKEPSNYDFVYDCN